MIYVSERSTEGRIKANICCLPIKANLLSHQLMAANGQLTKMEVNELA